MDTEEKGFLGAVSYPFLWIAKMILDVILMPVNWVCLTFNLEPVGIVIPFYY